MNCRCRFTHACDRFYVQRLLPRFKFVKLKRMESQLSSTKKCCECLNLVYVTFASVMPYRKAFVTIVLVVLLLIARLVPVAISSGMWREFWVSVLHLVVTGAGVALLIAPRGSRTVAE